MKKRGQVTVFIIIAIIILFSSAIFLYVTRYRESALIDTDVSTAINVPPALKPISDFVERCGEKALTDGLDIAGNRGGYIYIPDDSNFIRPLNDVPEGDMYILSGGEDPDESSYIPYWLYERNGIDTSRRPLLNRPAAVRPNTLDARQDISIQAQLEKYIAENLQFCLNGFENFKTQGFDIKELSVNDEFPVKTEVTFSDSGVSVAIDYPLQIAQKDIQNTISTFRSESPRKFKRMNDLEFSWRFAAKG